MNKSVKKWDRSPEPSSRPDAPIHKSEAGLKHPGHDLAHYGKGRVLTISPHPEATKALRPMLAKGLLWAAGKAN